jgi:signal transduction histidine kinase/HAMP domain-containing protein
VAREVGVEGKLGGQAKVPGAAGTWKGLTENVNQLAANLTTQVRAIAEVATAVTQGDLTRSITVEARGEVAALKDTTNEMIRNLRDTTQKNTEQDWLKTNLAKFSRMLQGQKDLNTVGRLILSELAPVVAAQHAVFYVLDASRERPRLTLLASYGSKGQTAIGSQLELGEGLVGQCAIEKEKILLSKVPLDYITIFSGLGAAPPQNILVLPVIFEDQVKGVVELASFERFSATHEAFLDQLAESIGIVINTIEANTRTVDLLTQSQSLAQELQSRQLELQQTNQELEEKAGLLAHQNQEVERKNQEVEQARKALEEKAEQLALTSKYKSEFLANMSHELRTPLNSLLILSDQLCRNSDGNLTVRQVEFAKTIHSSGNDLLTLINDILDLSKIESGTVAVEPADLMLDELRRYVERTFRHVAEAKNVDFFIRQDPSLPRSMFADPKRPAAGAEEPPVELVQVHARGSRDVRDRGREVRLESAERNPEPCIGRRRVLGHGHRHRDLAGQAADHLRGVPAGRRQHESQVRRHGARPRDQSRAGAPAGRRNQARQRAAGRQHVHAVLARELRRRAHPARRCRASSARDDGTEARAAFGSLPRMPRRSSARLPIVRPDDAEAEAAHAIASLKAQTRLVNEVGDDRDVIEPDDEVLLVVENDLGFARFLLDTAREHGLQGNRDVARRGGARARRKVPAGGDHARPLPPDIDGWRVLNRLKNDPATRHIPVAVISTDESRDKALNSGAHSFVAKPIQSKEVLDALLDD